MKSNRPCTCSNCRNWQPAEDSGYGECRVGPPTVIPTNTAPHPITGIRERASITVFPTTANDDWCGIWQEKQPHVGTVDTATQGFTDNPEL